jgi:hypothetical protein
VFDVSRRPTRKPHSAIHAQGRQEVFVSAGLVPYLKTLQAAKKLGVAYWQLVYLIKAGRVSPARDGSGHYCWSSQDLQAAREALANRWQRRQQGVAHG